MHVLLLRIKLIQMRLENLPPLNNQNPKKKKKVVFRIRRRVFLYSYWSSCRTFLLTKRSRVEIYKDGVEGHKSFMFGAVYETSTVPGYLSALYHHTVPCAVCLVRDKSVVKMFPGKTISTQRKNDFSRAHVICKHRYKIFEILIVTRILLHSCFQKKKRRAIKQ